MIKTINISIKTALLGTLVGIAAMLCIAANPTPELPTQKWEYRVLEGGGGEKEINQLGREGWELVSESSCYIQSRLPSTIPGGGTVHHTLVFKRQLAK